jgi:uncharacterized protein YjbJ (UPF0337 family)
VGSAYFLTSSFSPSSAPKARGEDGFLKEQERYMNKDQVKGRVEEAKGKVKEVVGKAVSNKRVEAEGDVDQVAGKVQKTYGDAKNEVKKSR